MPIPIPKSMAGPLFSASLAYVSGGGSPENLGPLVYDLKQQAGIQATPGAPVASVVLGEQLYVYNLMDFDLYGHVWLIAA